MHLSLLPLLGLATSLDAFSHHHHHHPQRRAETRPKLIPGRYIIQLRPGVDPSVVNAHHDAVRRIAQREYVVDAGSSSPAAVASVSDKAAVCDTSVVTVTVTPTVTLTAGSSAATSTPGHEIQQFIERPLKIGHGSFNAYVGKFDEAAIRIIEKLDEVLSVCQDEYVYVDSPKPVSGEHSTYPTASDLPTGQAQAYPTGAVYPTTKYPVANNTVHDYPTGAVYPTAKYPVANNTVPHYPTASPSGISSARPSYGSSIPYKPAGNVTKESLGTQENSIYSLADISHKNGVSGLSTFTYIYDASAGAGTTAYVFDTGIRASHQEFEGRVRFGINGLTGSKTSAAKGVNDNDGHGTHVAGTLIGKTFGAAKKASAVDVKVFDGSAGTLSSILAGINWAVNDVTIRNIKQTAVFSMSFGARTDSTVIDDAIKAAYEVGILTVAAAGNDDAEISDTTPARIPEVFTVGYTNEQRRRVTNADGFQGSNYGPQLDIWAPGFQIVSADYLSDTGNRTESGTSMAAPLVSGMVCYLRALTGALGAPDEITGRILELGDKGVVTGVKDSANVLLYNGNGA